MRLGELGKIAKSIFNLALPAYCFNCKELLSDEKIICSNCYGDIPRIDNRHLDAFLIRIKDQYFDNVTVIFEYNDVFQKLIHFYKYQEYLKLANTFATSIISEINKHYDIITFVPLHESKERERGFNQSRIIAELVSNGLGLVTSNDLLIREKFTSTQTKLSRKQRINNVNKAFHVKNEVRDKSVLIIDDVITTGATLNECARVLKESGCKIADVAALATPTTILD